MDFEKPGMGAQFSQLGYLLKNTFTIIGRDKDILSPIIRMSVYAVLVVVLFFAGTAAIVAGMGGTGTLLLLAMVVAFIYKFFYYNHQELRLSRLVYDTACGRDATVQSARGTRRPERPHPDPWADRHGGRVGGLSLIHI